MLVSAKVIWSWLWDWGPGLDKRFLKSCMLLVESILEFLLIWLTSGLFCDVLRWCMGILHSSNSIHQTPIFCARKNSVKTWGILTGRKFNKGIIFYLLERNSQAVWWSPFYFIWTFLVELSILWHPFVLSLLPDEYWWRLWMCFPWIWKWEWCECLCHWIIRVEARICCCGCWDGFYQIIRFRPHWRKYLVCSLSFAESMRYSLEK